MRKRRKHEEKSSVDRIPVINELYGEEIYRFEMPANLQAAIEQLEGKLAEE